LKEANSVVKLLLGLGFWVCKRRNFFTKYIHIKAAENCCVSNQVFYNEKLLRKSMVDTFLYFLVFLFLMCSHVTL